MLEQTIADAIRNRHRLTINYEPGGRTIEPHVLGYSSEGNLLLRAYQVDGASKSGEPRHWKLFRVDRMASANDNGDGFDGPRPLYNPDDSAMKGGIIARL